MTSAPKKRKFGSDDQPQSDSHFHGLGCQAHGCPMIGVYGQIGGAGTCWAHDRLREAEHWPLLTQGILANLWLFKVAEKIACMSWHDLDRQAAKIDGYLRDQGRSDLCRMKNEGEFSERCSMEPRKNWAVRLRNAAYAKASESFRVEKARAA